MGGADQGTAARDDHEDKHSALGGSLRVLFNMLRRTQGLGPMPTPMHDLNHGVKQKRLRDCAVMAHGLYCLLELSIPIKHATRKR